MAGLFSGGKTTNVAQGTLSQFTSAQSTSPNDNDWRVRISVANPSIFGGGGGIQAPLLETNGVVFPYLPQISVTNSARYTSQQLTHSNYNSYFYDGSEVAPITITGDFTVQNEDEGRYLMAAIYFFRSVTKMFFGKDTLAGNPPPMVFLDGYGENYFPHVGCVVTNFTHTLNPDVDYVPIPVFTSSVATAGSGAGVNAKSPASSPKQSMSPSASSQVVHLPTTSTISVTVQPIYSRSNTYKNFSLQNFAQGQLLTGKGGFL
jgi:hypothetical protein